MPQSVLEAIRRGIWDFEPSEVAAHTFDSTHALPGSTGKLHILAERARRGLPLWHPNDRLYHDESDEEHF